MGQQVPAVKIIILAAVAAVVVVHAVIVSKDRFDPWKVVPRRNPAIWVVVMVNVPGVLPRLDPPCKALPVVELQSMLTIAYSVVHIRHP
jgi:hypothetical protein